MPLSSDYDVIVVGAGYAGLTAARELHRAGKRVLECVDNHSNKIMLEAR